VHHADLRVRITGLPTETRVGGEVTYRAVVQNVGHRAAKEIRLDLTTSELLVAVSAHGVRCDQSSEALACTSAVLRPGAAVQIEVTIRALALGRLVVRARAASISAEATLRNNVATATTPVLPSDSIHVDATYVAPSFRQAIQLDAVSGRHGEDPDGTMTMNWAGDVGAGRVTCVNILGNRAAVGVVTPSILPPPGTVATPYLLFVFTDNGSPGGGRDTFSLFGGATPYSCVFALSGNGSTITITTGEISIVDTP
jgi:hypothetical protein